MYEETVSTELQKLLEDSRDITALLCPLGGIVPILCPARPKEQSKPEQEDAELNALPPERIPLALLHETFGQFVAKCRNVSTQCDRQLPLAIYTASNAA